MIDNKARKEIITVAHRIVAREQWIFLLEVPDATYLEWYAYGLNVKARLRKETQKILSRAAHRIIRGHCLGLHPKIETTTYTPDGHVEEVITEYHPPDIDLLLEMLWRFFPDDFDAKVKVVKDWVASGETEPPQELIDDFDRTEQELLESLDQKDPADCEKFPF